MLPQPLVLLAHGREAEELPLEGVGVILGVWLLGKGVSLQHLAAVVVRPEGTWVAGGEYAERSCPCVTV